MLAGLLLSAGHRHSGLCHRPLPKPLGICGTSQAKLTDCTIAVRSPQSNSLRNHAGTLLPYPSSSTTNSVIGAFCLPSSDHPSTNSGIHSSKPPPLHTLPRQPPLLIPLPSSQLLCTPTNFHPSGPASALTSGAPECPQYVQASCISAPRSRCWRPHPHPHPHPHPSQQYQQQQQQ